MNLITRQLLLATFSKHETQTIDDLAKPENIGFRPEPAQLAYLLKQLVIHGHIIVLNGAAPVTYTITNGGIEENNRLQMGH